MDAVLGRFIIEEIQDMRCSGCGKKGKKEKKGAMQPKKVKAQPKEETQEKRDIRRTVKIITEV